MSILDFLLAGAMKYAAGTSGGEWAGPCPWCGGTDRFRVWPEHPSGAPGGRFMCRGCEKTGDAIQFLRDRDGLTYPEACAALGVEPRASSNIRPCPSGRGEWTPKPATRPPDLWREQAARFLAKCAANMTPDSAGMAYAMGRGLTPDTVARLGIGWNPRDSWEAREAWGLPAEVNKDTGKPKRVWLPAGLVLPSWRKSGLVAVKVRRTAWTPEDTMPKYVALPGSVPGLALGGGTGLPVVVVESELDSVLIWQEARDIAGALALGTVAGKPDAEAAAYLAAAPRLLLALDFDQAGIAAWPWWKEHFPTAEPWPSILGKDVGDLAGTPGLVRAWVEAGAAPLPVAGKAMPNSPVHEEVSKPRLGVLTRSNFEQLCPDYYQGCWSCPEYRHSLYFCRKWHGEDAPVSLYQDGCDSTPMRGREIMDS